NQCAAHCGPPEGAPALFHRHLKSLLNVMEKALCPHLVRIDTQYGCSLLRAAVGEQPAWTFRNRKNYSQEEDRRHNGNAKHQPPSLLCSQPVTDEVRECDSHGQRKLIKPDEHTARLRRGEFRKKERRGYRGETD